MTAGAGLNYNRYNKGSRKVVTRDGKQQKQWGPHMKLTDEDQSLNINHLAQPMAAIITAIPTSAKTPASAFSGTSSLKLGSNRPTPIGSGLLPQVKSENVKSDNLDVDIDKKDLRERESIL